MWFRFYFVLDKKLSIVFISWFCFLEFLRNENYMLCAAKHTQLISNVVIKPLRRCWNFMNQNNKIIAHSELFHWSGTRLEFWKEKHLEKTSFLFWLSLADDEKLKKFRLSLTSTIFENHFKLLSIYSGFQLQNPASKSKSVRHEVVLSRTPGRSDQRNWKLNNEKKIELIMFIIMFNRFPGYEALMFNCSFDQFETHLTP